jgi:multimeric flavodoxin WrbA
MTLSEKSGILLMELSKAARHCVADSEANENREVEMLEPKSQIQVVGVMSSARVNGYTATLVREALKGAEEEGARTTEIVLPKHQVNFCQGCFRCMAEGQCPAEDDFEALRKLLSDANGIILSSPTYGAAPSAMMKNLIDRLGLFEYFTSSTFGGKYVVGISTANNARAAKKVAQTLAGFLSSGIFQRGYVSGFLGASSRGKGVAEDPGILRRARELGKKLVRDIQIGRRYPFQNPIGGLVNRLILKPNFSAAILDNREGMMKGVYENLKQRGLLL